MNTQPKAVDLTDRRAILDEITILLESAGGIDETRAKQVRKAIDALRNSDPAPAPAEDLPVKDSPAEDAQTADPELDVKIDAGLETLRTRIHRQIERRNRDYEKALTLMDELEAMLKGNELQQAERAYNRLMSITGNIPGLSGQRWRDIEQRLNRVRPQLRKLESWRHWGTTQAREMLIREVSGLVQQDLPPEQLAKHIRQARDQWQALNKSGDHASNELWKTFDQACAEAYKPCRAHFRKLREQRAENLRQRQAVIDRLNARYESTDWKAPDWRELDRFVRQARRDFHRIGDVEFKQRKALARTLDEALERFEDHLARERTRSLRLRERLIADIEALAGADNLRETLEQLDILKKQWQVTVVGKRSQENKLWESFQAACELTYRRRDAERREQDAARDANLKQKQALIGELEQISAADDAELLANAAQLARTRERWQDIGPVPRTREKALDTRWREVQKRFKNTLQAAESRNESAELENLARRASLCRQWEQAARTDNVPDVDAARSEWTALPALAGDSATAMERRFTQVFAQPDNTTLAANLAMMQETCLKLEVILELDSPPECQGERMAYQVTRLNASLKKETDNRDSPDVLLRAALTTGAVPAAAAADIEARLANCLAHYKTRLASQRN